MPSPLTIASPATHPPNRAVPNRHHPPNRHFPSRDRKGAVLLVFLLTLAALASADTVDRLAVIVGNTVITESEVLREVRLTEFLNEQPLDLASAQRKAAAERLVDQTLIRNEMELSRYPLPASSEAEAMLQKIRDARFKTDAEYGAALARYGITGDELLQHLHWQLAAMRFTEVRFQTRIPQTDAQSADRADSAVDDQMDAWLKDARANTKVQFKKEAFQ